MRFARLVLLGAVFLAASGLAEDRAPLRIGVIFPFTGKETRQAQLGKAGIELALAEFDDFHPKVFYQDSGSDPKQAVVAFNKLQTLDKIDVILTMGSPIVMALLPLANRAKVPLLAMAVVSGFSVPDDYGFRLMGTAQGFGKRVSDLLRHDLQKQRIAVAYVNDDYGTTYAQFFDTVLGPALAARESYLPGTTDFRSLLLKLKAARPDAVILAAWGVEVGMLLRQAKEIDFTPGVFVCSGACDNPDVAVSAEGAADTLVIVASTNKTSTARTADLLNRFHEVPTSVVLRFYDSINVLRYAADRCAASAGERGVCLRNELSAASGVPGSSYPIRFDPNGDIIDSYQLKGVRNGKLVPVKLDGQRVVPE